MFESSNPSRVSPRGLIAAASRALPARVRLTSSHSSPITTQQSTAMTISFFGVRTPAMLTTPGSNARIVTGLSVKR